MYRYNAYISKQLVHSTLLITISLTSIVWLTQALRFIDFIVNQGISISMFLTLTTLLVPSLLFMILPPAFFCAVLFSYNKLKIDSELIVMQAAGLSNWKLARPALQVAAIMMAVCYFIAFYLQPVTYAKFKDMQVFLRNNYASILLQEGVFSSPVSGLTVFIRERDKNNILHGILVHDSRVAGSSVTMMAEEGEMVETPQGPRFLLRSGNRQEIKDGRLSFLNFASYALDISLYASTMNARYKDPQEMYVGDLFATDSTVSESENNRRWAEGNQRLIWPGYIGVLALLALSVLFSGQFNRRGHWQKLLFACIAAAAILFASVGLRGSMSLNPAMAVVAWMNLFVPAVLAAWVIHGNTLPNPLVLARRGV
ncbi:MAG: LPS export ABC transporter permease LptF [Alphaproteobacteria bacterium]